MFILIVNALNYIQSSGSAMLYLLHFHSISVGSPFGLIFITRRWKWSHVIWGGLFSVVNQLNDGLLGSSIRKNIISLVNRVVLKPCFLFSQSIFPEISTLAPRTLGPTD